jgi:hypothetical protein
MKNLSTGTGLALLATAIVAYPFVNRISSVDQTAHASVPVAAIAAAATAQANPEPTIVWYATAASGVAMRGTNALVGRSDGFWILRAWSDGRVEARWVKTYDGWSEGVITPLNSCESDSWNGQPCIGPWVVISDANQGSNAASDINFDERVDGADLAQLLANFGDAPRQDIPPSDCPLNLINP